MEEKNKHLVALIAAAEGLIRDGVEEARQHLPGFPSVAQLLHTKQARLVLRIEFNPLPSVTCDVIRDDDGELIGEIFTIEATRRPTN